MATIITNTNQLTANKWYAIGLEDETGCIDWSKAPIYFYAGNGEWRDDAQEDVREVWDTFLQLPVGINGADAFCAQS